MTGVLAILWVCLVASPRGVASDFDEVMLAGTDRVQVAQASQERIDEVVARDRRISSPSTSRS